MGVVLFSSFHYDKNLTEDLFKNIDKPPKDIKATVVLSYPNLNYYEDFIKFYPMDYKIFHKMGIKNIAEFDMFNSVDFKIGLKRLMSSDIILLNGGNTFFFNKYLKEYEIDKKIIELYKNGKIVMGESAGSIILTPKTDIAQFADRGYSEYEDNTGLGLVDFEVKPHGEMWRHKIKLLNEYADKCENKVYMLKENDIIYVNGNNIKYYGTPELLGGYL